eukprot:TRINITY_DN6700_c0_g1_i3.p1 TRINITY_DN6700_c0_g1~~TRINITY_DN6700_c0_g1_i3.p1  ORF type:complete len:189 (+),score=47.01 TRINITY_DN6700_c0_g1_i3:650-1216(+)
MMGQMDSKSWSPILSLREEAMIHYPAAADDVVAEEAVLHLGVEPAREVWTEVWWQAIHATCFMTGGRHLYHGHAALLLPLVRGRRVPVGAAPSSSSSLLLSGTLLYFFHSFEDGAFLSALLHPPPPPSSSLARCSTSSTRSCRRCSILLLFPPPPSSLLLSATSCSASRPSSHGCSSSSGVALRDTRA